MHILVFVMRVIRVTTPGSVPQGRAWVGIYRCDAMNRAEISTGVVERVKLSPQCAHPAFGQAPHPKATQDEVPSRSE